MEVLLLILQRYYFESESQRNRRHFLGLSRCCLSYKDTILKANHSWKLYHICASHAVAYPTKILFWKRITAITCCFYIRFRLLLILQRYYFESESQLTQFRKAIQCAVAYPTKILFWKRITAYTCHIYADFELLLILQRYYFESESQHLTAISMLTFGCCLSYKDTILKANHSRAIRLPNFATAVAYPTKILFWKRITAVRFIIYRSDQLLLILQRYYFESESQPPCWGLSEWHRCCLSYKDTILKANHSWKLYHICASQLLLILQRYYFESESQQRKAERTSISAVAYPTKILFWKRITAETERPNR